MLREQQAEVTAEEIALDALDVTARGLLENRFDLFHPYFATPCTIETFESESRLETVADIRCMFDAVRAHYVSLRVTDLDRQLIAAEFTSPDRMITTHETRVLCKALLVQEPFPVFSVHERFGSQWKIVRSSYAIQDQPRHILALTKS